MLQLSIHNLISEKLINLDQPTFFLRTKEIRWNVIFKSCVEIIGCIFFTEFILYRIVLPHYSHFGGELPSFGEKIYLFVQISIPFGACGFALFYLVLHSFLNAVGELSRFADRQFYKVNIFYAYVEGQ